ncbi:hypothetical protein LY76DRAFT_591467 [Colletotrichum caudatum]|nr:hypothetical protein LY76DRAFT_591467 [Colletotrichum caudatum]
MRRVASLLGSLLKNECSPFDNFYETLLSQEYLLGSGDYRARDLVIVQNVAASRSLERTLTDALIGMLCAYIHTMENKNNLEFMNKPNFKL